MVKDIVAKINGMNLNDVQIAREDLSMTNGIDKHKRHYVYGLLDAREHKLKQSTDITHSEVKPDEIGLYDE